MPLIDERGRLFGKLNVIDAVAIVFVILLVPIAYGAMLLFRVPKPTIASVEPAQVLEHQPGTVVIAGTDFRPFLRASFDGVWSPGFLVQSPSRAEVKVPDLPAGTYDLVLYDEAQELIRKPGALRVVGIPAPRPSGVPVQVVGRFLDLSPEDAPLIAVGLRFGQSPVVAETLAVRPVEPAMQRVRVATTSTIETPIPGRKQVPAILRVSCVVSGLECRTAGGVVAKDAVLSLSMSDESAKQRTSMSVSQLMFLVDETRPGDSPVVFSLR